MKRSPPRNPPKALCRPVQQIGTTGSTERRRTVRETALVTSLASNVSQVRAAQRLRYRVFAEEMGAEVPGREQGIDCDIFDAYCDHLVVTDTASREIVGTYRLLPWRRARRAGGFYAQHEFDLSGISE